MQCDTKSRFVVKLLIWSLWKIWNGQTSNLEIPGSMHAQLAILALPPLMNDKACFPRVALLIREPELELKNLPAFAHTCCRKVMWVDLWQLLCVRDIDIIVSITNDPLLQVWFKGLAKRALLLITDVKKTEITHTLPKPKLQCSGSLYIKKKSISAFAFFESPYGFPSWHFLYEIMSE